MAGDAGRQNVTDSMLSNHNWQPNASRIGGSKQNGTVHEPRNVRIAVADEVLIRLLCVSAFTFSL